MNALNELPVGEIIRKLEEIEIAIEVLQGDKSRLYQTAECLEHNVMVIRQVLHHRREYRKRGGRPLASPSRTFIQYLAAVEDGK